MVDKKLNKSKNQVRYNCVIVTCKVKHIYLKTNPKNYNIYYYSR